MPFWDWKNWKFSRRWMGLSIWISLVGSPSIDPTYLFWSPSLRHHRWAHRWIDHNRLEYNHMYRQCVFKSDKKGKFCCTSVVMNEECVRTVLPVAWLSLFSEIYGNLIGFVVNWQLVSIIPVISKQFIKKKEKQKKKKTLIPVITLDTQPFRFIILRFLPHGIK